MKPIPIIIMIIISLIFVEKPGRNMSWALENERWDANLSADWGGHLRIQGMVSRPEDETVYELVGIRTYYDGVGDFRLKNRIFFSDFGYFETHYEAIIFGGDTRRKETALVDRYAYFAEDFLFIREPVNDDKRLMDLTSVINETNEYIFYQRLDRLYLALQFEKGMVRVGRQALTWGNGLLFNPMDLFNPFSPTDFIRDYKIGDDMITAQFDAAGVGEFQFLYVPRRDPVSSSVEWDQTSLAGKFHFAKRTTEYDMMVAKHYKDGVIGFGSAGYFLDAAWRMDVTWTFLDEGSKKDGFLSLVANMDYSWIWFDKNFYGFIEFYYNGIGEEVFLNAVVKEDILQRMDRGELFTFCKAYLAGQIQIELHPLLKIYFTVINNLNDGSGAVQPRAVLDVTSDVQFMVGGNIYYGGAGTENGGLEIPIMELVVEPTNNAFMTLTYFF